MKTKKMVSMILALFGITLIAMGCGTGPAASNGGSAGVFPTNLEFEQPEALK